MYEYGTVKVGRWAYPARQDSDGNVERNEKRDGSGDWSETNPVLFTPIGEGDPAAEEVARFYRDTETPDVAAATSVPVIEGFVEEPQPEPKSSHGGKVGAQTRRPGKSTWEVGTECPQGHTLDSEDDIYVMPSGRKQCRKCRSGHRSNKPAA